jgi:2-amino-4-hydroxy-6-hydroxymethyldihydropteridine diphosphokinase
VFICGYNLGAIPRTKTIYLSLGSNVGDRAAQIARAVEALAAAGMRVARQSSLYSTEPVDVRTQSWFLNCVLEAETDLLPRQLLRVLQEVERSLGRKRLVRRGPRAMDIDLLLYGASVMRAPELEVPHPRMAERRFVLVPLAELAPMLRHPTLRKTVAELLAETRDRSSVRRWRPKPAP